MNDTRNKSLPIEKNIVILLCKYVREEAREVATKSGTFSKQYIVYVWEICTHLS